MQKLKDYLSSIPKDYDPENIYKDVLPLLVEENLLTVINQSISFKDFHKNLFELAKLPHGIGLGVSLMAQVNIAGRIIFLAAKNLNHPVYLKLLNGLTKGEYIISLGVSEPDWKGRLSNIKTNITFNNGKYQLDGEKSFFTNGYHSTHFLVVARMDGNYKVVLLEKENTGLEITKFTLPFAKEATHCRIKMNSVQINEEDILNLDYSKYAENLRLSEMLSLSTVFCGYAISTLEQIKANSKLVSILKEEEDKQKEILRCKTLVHMLYSRILELSELKDNLEEIELKEFFPYGTELVSDEFYKTLSNIFPKEEIEPYFIEKQLFQYRDILNESYIRRAARSASGLIKT
ncbi:MAG TPA: acyl-CoA dehydrogenase family protein [Leptospiraceae bacterium]|nr:acyl-CoA dehydrogenase family protein [Leptospiraceae bacterium]HMX32354.1 acyl-CoA dehydrogenase family protein [Leptospiraceae bacterium]HMY32673.1 acyl-CoA dehydrogenase family protein [Leptospiraceae bacterium]HMZ66047.1 acyl-CoA dehydrogenase family protein [Leptospiraceae bacterium]HNA05408.1 acyl-CoA dehydrogenase family protein [Leptospiraceae bacterium]